MVLNNVNIYNFEMPKLAVQYACILNYLVGAGTLVSAHERESAVTLPVGRTMQNQVDPCTRQARFQVSGIPTTCTIGRQATMEPL